MGTCLLTAVIALHVSFWLQLGGVASAAVTVAILAQPTRGAALAKAVNRIGRRDLNVFQL